MYLTFSKVDEKFPDYKIVLHWTFVNTGLGHLDGHPIRHGGLRGALLAEGGVEYKVPVKSSEKNEYVNEP